MLADVNSLYLIGYGIGATACWKCSEDDSNVRSCICIDPLMDGGEEVSLIQKANKPLLLVSSESWFNSQALS